MSGQNFNNYYQPAYGQQSSNYYPNYYPATPQNTTGYQNYQNYPNVQYPGTQQVQIPQPPQSTQPRGITGRVINSPDEVTPNEVPMDRSVSFFPSSDYSCIYAKQWDSDGTIKTIKYVPEVVEEKIDTKPQLDLSEMMSKRFDQLETLLNNNLVAMSNMNRPSKRKEN